RGPGGTTVGAPTDDPRLARIADGEDSEGGMDEKALRVSVGRREAIDRRERGATHALANRPVLGGSNFRDSTHVNIARRIGRDAGRRFAEVVWASAHVEIIHVRPARATVGAASYEPVVGLDEARIERESADIKVAGRVARHAGAVGHVTASRRLVHND